MGLLNKYNEKEKELLDIYFDMFNKMGVQDAKKVAESLLDSAIEEAKKMGLPPNVGDLLLEKEKNDDKTHLILERKRNEGVKDEDIRQWWNKTDLERMMMLKFDELNRFVLFKKLVEENGLSDEDAMDQIRKYHPIYGNSEDMTYTRGEDRPLPEELKNRINIYTERMNNNSNEFKKEIESSSSFNALMRKKIKNGAI